MGCIRIERAENGYIVRMDDPAIVAKNRKPNRTTPYIEPEREFVFDDEAGVVAFVTRNLDKAMPTKKDDFDTSFDLAIKEDDEEDSK